jgi:hypothetical protein
VLWPKGGKDDRASCEDGQDRPGPLRPLWLMAKLTWLFRHSLVPAPFSRVFAKTDTSVGAVWMSALRGGVSFSGELRMPLNS